MHPPMPSRAIYKIALLSIMLGALTAPKSFSEEFEEATLPDTPAGRQFKTLLEIIEQGDQEAFVRENFNREFLEAFPMERHLELFSQMRIMSGGFLVHTIQESSDFELVVLAKTKKGAGWRRLDIIVEPEPPHKIAGLGIDVASAPSEESETLGPITESEALKHVQSTLDDMAARDEFSGAVLIAVNGEPLFRRAYGKASKEFGVPNRPDTKFNIGSINKTFTSLAIAQLLERGEIGLDDKIGKYLPGLPEGWADKITIRHLLTMRSGLGHYWNEEWESKFSRIRTVDDLMEIIVRTPLEFEPGTKAQYSNSGYVVLGAIIESVTGQSYYDYVRDNIFKPAGMTDTDSYEVDQIVPNLARGYTQNRSANPYGNNKLQNNFFLHSVKGSPAGGGFSTVDDLNRYVEALKDNRLAGEKHTNMVLGMFENADKRPEGLGIAGGAPVGINAVIEVDFETGYTVIVLSNYDPPTAMELGGQFMRMLQSAE